MRYRKLRIAWSVVWGVACVLLIVLWVRSYHIEEAIDGPIWNNYSGGIWSTLGTMQFVVRNYGSVWTKVSIPPRQDDDPSGSQVFQSHLGVSIRRLSSNGGDCCTIVKLRYWLLVVLSNCVAICVWLPFKRFSLRTLVIATTLVAVTLGLIVWLNHTAP
jgi:hypothetical protein